MAAVLTGVLLASTVTLIFTIAIGGGVQPCNAPGDRTASQMSQILFGPPQVVRYLQAGGSAHRAISKFLFQRTDASPKHSFYRLGTSADCALAIRLVLYSVLQFDSLSLILHRKI